MRKPLLIIGILLLAAGGLTRTDTKRAPLNLGWILLGAGGLAVVVGAVSRK